jgi:uracil-DNA glycosylase family 4
LRVHSEVTAARTELATAQSMAAKPPAATARPVPAKNISPVRTAAPPIPVERGVSLFEESDKIADDSLEKIRADIGDCTRCKLCEKRTNIVFGVGNPKAELVFVGEGPGRDEDAQGEPFVGRAGQLLTQMIEAMGLKRSDVYICNVVKCRPPENRLPEKDEIEICSPFLLRQLDTIKPKIIVALGSCAVQTLMQTKQGITGLRGKFFPFRGMKLMATYHPAYLLRNPPAKPDVWKDLQLVMAELGLPEPKKKTVKK